MFFSLIDHIEESIGFSSAKFESQIVLLHTSRSNCLQPDSVELTLRIFEVRHWGLKNSTRLKDSADKRSRCWFKLNAPYVIENVFSLRLVETFCFAKEFDNFIHYSHESIFISICNSRSFYPSLRQSIAVHSWAVLILAWRVISIKQ